MPKSRRLFGAGFTRSARANTHFNLLLRRSRRLSPSIASQYAITLDLIRFVFTLLSEGSEREGDAASGAKDMRKVLIARLFVLDVSKAPWLLPPSFTKYPKLCCLACGLALVRA